MTHKHDWEEQIDWVEPLIAVVEHTCKECNMKRRREYPILEYSERFYSLKERKEAE